MKPAFQQDYQAARYRLPIAFSRHRSRREWRLPDQGSGAEAAQSILRWHLVLPALILLLTTTFASHAASPRVLPEKSLPEDSRLGQLKTLRGYFPLEVPSSRKAWEKRAEVVRRQIRVATGQWPEADKTPLNVVVHGKVERDQYSVEKVYLESFPGYYVTGNLYRPKGVKGPLPAVLSPHGHWQDGRFYDAGDTEKMKKQLESGAEKFSYSGRFPKQARCVQLARMGCLVFHWDMAGYADSVQIPLSVIHRHGRQRPQLNSAQGWGLYSAQAELRLQSPMGLHTLNAIRALDWVCSLPEVDKNRIAVTGASGGGTQTFILSAIDPRPAVAFPAVMVSTAMQGGCTCENASLLRVGTGNIEIAALFAPKPLGMTAANDWTKEMQTKGFPELQQVYALYNAKQNVMLAPYLQFGHNYNYVSRAAMYNWLNVHLDLGQKSPVVETDFRPLTRKEMSVWDDTHKQPASDVSVEVDLLRRMDTAWQKQFARLVPQNEKGLKTFQHVVGGALEAILHRKLPQPNEIAVEKVGEKKNSGLHLLKRLVRYKPGREEVPTLVLQPEKPSGDVAIWLTGSGKQQLFASGNRPIAAVEQLLSSGVTVVTADLFGTGEFRADGKPLKQWQMVHDNDRQAACFTLGYNDSLFVKRVHDILTVIAYAQGTELAARRILLVGNKGAGIWVAAARTQAGNAVDKTVIATDGFRFAGIEDYRDANLLPGAIKYGDLPGLLALSVPAKVCILGEDRKDLELAEQVYDAAGAKNHLRVMAKEKNSLPDSLRWLLAK